MTIDTQKLRHMASRLSITNDDDVSAALKSAAGHINAQAAEIERLRTALAEISEYWNRDQNEQAMHDACWHAINTASAALSGEPT